MNGERLAALATMENDSMIYIIDCNTYELLYCNPQAKETYHIDADASLQNMKCYEALHGNTQPCVACQCTLASDNRFYHWRHYNTKLRHFIDIRSKRIHMDDRNCYLCISDFAGSDLSHELSQKGLSNASPTIVGSICTEESLEKLSFKDSMTGLFNRNYYTILLQQLANHPPQQLGIIYLDLNELKYINDNQGHTQGDILIQKTASNIISVFGKDSMRIGGDEFVIVLADITKNELQQQLDLLKNRMIEDHISISAGTSWRDSNVKINEQIAEAEYAMYRDKDAFYKNRLEHIQ